jgi:tetratricopeptide (TPR) repeat protein
LQTGLNAGRRVLGLAAKILEARIAEHGEADDAIWLWEEAVAIEDTLAYNEPADWFYPTRHYLGAALLDVNRARDAEAVFRADLEKHPENGWALLGLARALRAQERRRDAATALRRHRDAFRHADIRLERPAF